MAVEVTVGRGAPPAEDAADRASTLSSADDADFCRFAAGKAGSGALRFGGDGERDEAEDAADGEVDRDKGRFDADDGTRCC